MKWMLRILLVSMLLGPLAAADGIFPFEYREVKLDNGFTAYLIDAGSPGQLAYVTIVRTGSRDEWEPGRSGYAHFFEHMMFRGTEKYPNFDEVLTAIGADSNAFTSSDMTVYHIVASSESLPTLVDLESDRFQNLSYDESEFRTEAGAVLGEFNQGRANPFSFLFEKLLDTAFDKHTYKHTTIGFEADVRSMPEGFDYSRSFFERYYRPENVVLVVAGDFDFDNAEQLIRSHYSGWQRGYRPPQITPEPEQTAPREATVHFPGSALPAMVVAYKIPAWKPDSRLAVAVEVLGQVAFGPNSDIYRELVVDSQTVQFIQGDFGTQRDPGLGAVFAAATDQQKLYRAQRAIEAAVERFTSQPPSQEALNTAKRYMRYDYLMDLETARDVAFSLIGTVVNTGGIEAINTFYQTLEKVTPEDVMEAARLVLQKDKRTIVTLLPAGMEREPEMRMDEAGSFPDVVTLPEPDSPFVSFNIWFKAGSQNDPPGKEGLAALTAAVLEDSSTRNNSYEQILAKLYPMAAGYSSSVDKEMTVFRGTVHKDNLDEYYGLFTDAILAPAFKEEDFQRIKSRLMSYLERQRRFSSDEELGKELLFREIFRGTPYEHPEEGYVETVRALTLQDVKDFYAGNYLRGNVVMGVAGDYPENMPRRLRSDFDALPAGSTDPVPAPQPQPIEGLNVLIVEKDTSATAISMGYPYDLLRSDDDFYAMMLANSWLGEHRSSASHLYQVIREARGMNYGDYSYIEAYPLGHTISLPPQNVARRKQIFQIWIRPVSGLQEGDLHNRALFATRAALREFQDLVDDGMTQQEFEITRGFLKNYTVNYGSTLSRRLGYRIDDYFYGIEDEPHLESIKSELDALSLEDVNQAIKRYLQYDDMWIVFITKDAEGLKRLLVSGAASPIEYPGEKPEEILSEDRIIQAFPLPVQDDKIKIIHINDVLER
ncbi:MAG TPA: pitrilysin family protein [Acidobacteriota bacterium]|nr:pitrilysin family protein [Acidobacteriota bacterium]